jgi:cell division protein FtsL
MLMLMFVLVLIIALTYTRITQWQDGRHILQLNAIISQQMEAALDAEHSELTMQVCDAPHWL